MFNQISSQYGINIFGEIEVTSILKYYTQFYDMSMLYKLKPDKNFREEKKQSLHKITLIKEKRFGKIKGHACADSIY